jgi:hypothetical protein
MKVSQVSPQTFIGSAVKLTALFVVKRNPEFNPVSSGITFVVDYASGPAASSDQAVTVPLPAGAYGGAGTRGWTLSTKKGKKTFKYTDTTGSPIAGVDRVTIILAPKAIAKQGYDATLTASGSNGTYQLINPSQAMRVALLLGDGADDRCETVQFKAKNCKFNSAHTALTCTRP